VDESLNRAYYGERAETRGFTIKLEKSFDPDVGVRGEADMPSWAGMSANDHS
jgi:hypothetical protein